MAWVGGARCFNPGRACTAGSASRAAVVLADELLGLVGAERQHGDAASRPDRDAEPIVVAFGPPADLDAVAHHITLRLPARRHERREPFEARHDDLPFPAP